MNKIIVTVFLIRSGLLLGMDDNTPRAAKEMSKSPNDSIRIRRYEQATFLPHGTEILVLQAFDALGKKVSLEDPSMVDVKIVTSIPKDQT